MANNRITDISDAADASASEPLTAAKLDGWFRGRRLKGLSPPMPVLALIADRWTSSLQAHLRSTRAASKVAARFSHTPPPKITRALETLQEALPAAIAKMRIEEETMPEGTEDLQFLQWLLKLEAVLGEWRPASIVGAMVFDEIQSQPPLHREPWHEPALRLAQDLTTLFQLLNLGPPSLVADSRLIRILHSTLNDQKVFRRNGIAPTRASIAQWVQRKSSQLKLWDDRLELLITRKTGLTLPDSGA